MLSITQERRGRKTSITDKKTKSRYCFNLRAIDELGFVDSGFGFFAALASISKIDENAESQIDEIRRILIHMRQFMTIQEAFCGIDFDKANSNLFKLSRPEHLLFEGNIEPHIFANLNRKVFEPLVPDHFLEVRDYDPRTRSFPITKKPDKESSEPVFLGYILDVLRRSCSFKVSTLADPDFRPFYNRRNFRRRAEFTCELQEYFSENKTIDLIRKFNNKIIPTSQYDENENFGLVGVTRRVIPQGDNSIDPATERFQTCLYFMYHYNLKDEQKDKSLAEINLDLNHLLPNLLEHDYFVKKILAESATKLCNPPGKEYYVQKVLARVPHTKKVCVLFWVFFSRDVIDADEYENPCSVLCRFIQDEINKRLMDDLQKDQSINFDDLVGDLWIQKNPQWEVMCPNDIIANPLDLNEKGDDAVQ